MCEPWITGNRDRFYFKGALNFETDDWLQIVKSFIEIGTRLQRHPHAKGHMSRD